MSQINEAELRRAYEMYIGDWRAMRTPLFLVRPRGSEEMERIRAKGYPDLPAWDGEDEFIMQRMVLPVPGIQAWAWIEFAHGVVLDRGWVDDPDDLNLLGVTARQ
jgi:hypothetical protein